MDQLVDSTDQTTLTITHRFMDHALSFLQRVVLGVLLLPLRAVAGLLFVVYLANRVRKYNVLLEGLGLTEEELREELQHGRDDETATSLPLEVSDAHFWSLHTDCDSSKDLDEHAVALGIGA